LRVGADDLGLIGLAAVGGHFKADAIGDDVIVGEDITVARDEKSRPERDVGIGGGFVGRGRRRAKFARGGVGGSPLGVIRRSCVGHLDADADDSRLHAFDDIGKADRRRRAQGIDLCCLRGRRRNRCGEHAGNKGEHKGPRRSVGGGEAGVAVIDHRSLPLRSFPDQPVFARVERACGAKTAN
jgi:hypothetical protein